MAVAKANALDVDIVNVKPGDAKLVEKFPLGKIPGFVGVDGFTLHECNAIAIYCKSQPGGHYLEDMSFLKCASWLWIAL